MQAHRTHHPGTKSVKLTRGAPSSAGRRWCLLFPVGYCVKQLSERGPAPRCRHINRFPLAPSHDRPTALPHPNGATFRTRQLLRPRMFMHHTHSLGDSFVVLVFTDGSDFRTFSLGRFQGWQLLTNELSSFYYTWEAEKVSESLVVQWRFMKFWATATAFICKGPGFRKANASDCRTVAAPPPP